MNEFDQFVKHELKVEHYARYTDDFVVVANDKKYLEGILPAIGEFLKTKLKLDLHPNKVSIKPIHQGADFLGYVNLPHHVVLRTKTKQRIFKKLKQKIKQFKLGQVDRTSLEATLNSYLGVFSHANTHKLRQELLNKYWIWLTE